MHNHIQFQFKWSKCSAMQKYEKATLHKANFLANHKFPDLHLKIPRPFFDLQLHVRAQNFMSNVIKNDEKCPKTIPVSGSSCHHPNGQFQLHLTLLWSAILCIFFNSDGISGTRATLQWHNRERLPRVLIFPVPFTDKWRQGRAMLCIQCHLNKAKSA